MKRVAFGSFAVLIGSWAFAACGSDDSETGGAAGTGAAAGTAGAHTGGSAGTSGGGSSTGGKGGQGGTAGSSKGGSSQGGSGGTSPGGSGGTSTGGTAQGGTGGVAGAGGQAGSGDLPQGNTGIASKYPGDSGIKGDSNVLWADDFESYTDPNDLWQTWSNVFQMNQTRIATEQGAFYAGAKGLEFTVPQQDDELSNAVVMNLTTERDILFLRYHSKYSSPFDVVGSSHNGSSISAHYQGPGIRANGTNHFMVAYEAGRFDTSVSAPGQLNVYVYHPLQRDIWGDHFLPTGEVSPNTSLPFDFGPTFVPRSHVVPPLEQWNCYELMVKANTPGELNGRIAMWFDGTLIADFPNLRLRDVDTLRMDQFSIGLHVKNNVNGEVKKWYDNVVVATAYIGPMVQ
jgi:hypothetical protein